MTPVNFDSLVRPLRNRLLATLRDYVELESPTGDFPAIAAFVDRLAVDFGSLGATIERENHPTGTHLTCVWPGTVGLENAAPILFLAHSDTVWPVGTLEWMPWRTERNTVRGPGVFDMKGGIVALQGALRLVAAVASAHRPITLVITADEEIGSPTSRELVELHARTAFAAIGLEPAHPDGALKTSRWGSTRIRISVTGREAHAALDAASGVSAIDELVDRLVELRTIVGDYPQVLCNVGVLSGGGRTNVVAGTASADVGLRFADASSESAVLGRLRSLRAERAGATVEVTVLSIRPAWTAGPTHDALCAAIGVAGAAVDQPISGRPASGAADTNITGALGTPSIDGLGPIGRGAHAADEQIRLSSITERATLIASIIGQL